MRAKLRGWFDPREGIARLTRTDWLFMGGFVLVAFAVAIVKLAWPAEKIFDEVYFARAGEEYLKGVPQFEWTHPPFTKLVIALSIALFGDNSFGWRCLNVVIGSLQIAVLYAFAKRLTASTMMASLAALLLTFDGFHFVEQRISTGEITISTLILIALYAFYRYWLAAQIRIERLVAGRFGAPFWLTLAAGVPVAAGFSWLVNRAPADHTTQIANGIWPTVVDAAHAPSLTVPYAVSFLTGGGGDAAYAHLQAFLYAMLGVYLFARIVVARRLPAAGERVSYADGTTVRLAAGGKPVVTAPPGPATPSELKIDYGRDGTMRYATPGATAEFAPDGTLRVDGEPASTAGSATVWLAVLAVSLGLLLSSKWNGFFDLATVFVVLGFVWAQRFLGGRALYGNPRGFPLDVVAGLLLFVPATIYALSYIPMYVLGGGHNLTDLMSLQWQMFNYHSHVTGTHPYMSVAWQWPIMQIPISYYYHDFRAGLAASQGGACCVAEILALPNPLVFLLGLASVPFVGWLAWRERNKGYALLVLAYFVQWLPWFHSPRMLFEYHFFPNLALIVLCDVILVQRLLRRFEPARARWYAGRLRGGGRPDVRVLLSGAGRRADDVRRLARAHVARPARHPQHELDHPAPLESDGQLGAARDQRGARVDPQHVEDALGLVADRRLAAAQRRGDVAVGLARAQLAQHPALGRREVHQARDQPLLDPVGSAHQPRRRQLLEHGARLSIALRSSNTSARSRSTTATR